MPRQMLALMLNICRSRGIVVLALLSLTTSLLAQVGAILHPDTEANNSKSNQNRVWLHNGKWWAIAPHGQSNTDYIWRYDGAGVWARTTTKLEKGTQNRYDVIMDSPAGELVILRSHNSKSKFYRYAYNAGTWTKVGESDINSFGNVDDSNPLTIIKAHNGNFWVFRVDSSKVQAKKSIDGGEHWSSIVNIKAGLNTVRGTTDAVVFSANTGPDNYLGVAYGEIGTIGINTVFGFLYHRDGDADNVWTDETSFLTYFGTERGNNALSLAVDPDNNIYLFTRTFGGGSNDPRNTLYKRTGANTWARHMVSTVSGINWNSPGVAIDTSNNSLFLSGIRSDSSFAEYKFASLGRENLLSSVPRNVLMQDGIDVFEHLSMPRQYLNPANGMIVTAGNITENTTWFSEVFTIIVGSITVATNEINARGRYTIPLSLTDTTNGTLAAGSGKITIRFRNATIVPASIATGHVTVNGATAAAVVTDPILSQVTITTALTLPGGTDVTVVIDSLANVINPCQAGLDSLQAWTSKQRTPIYSPPYAFVHALTHVTPAQVTVAPTDPAFSAAYTLGFRLGSHGRMCASSDTIHVYFNSASKVAQGALTGVTVNTLAATASGDSAKRSVHIIVPPGLSLLNNDSVTVILPGPGLTNPGIAGFYNLFVSTSAETSKVASLSYQIVPSCGMPIPGTFDNFTRGNQNKTFFHDGFWWLVAPSSVNKFWYLWKFNGLAWIQGVLISDAPKDRPDLWREALTNKLYVLLPGGSNTRLTRLSFTGVNWSVDSGYPKTVNSVQLDIMNLLRAKNGHLWAIWIADSTLRAQRSGNEGNTWSPVINIKRHLNEQQGLTDAVAFQIGTTNVIGVGYAEDSGVPNARFGFLYHKDSDGDNVWTDETASLPPFTATTADDHIAMATHNKQVFMIVKTKGGGGSVVKNALYHRKTTGTWARYTVNQGGGWTRPVISVDVTNNVLYVMGTRESGVSSNVEMKRVKFGSFASLPTAPIDTLLCDPIDDFFDLTAPAHNVSSAAGFMLVANNETDGNLWYRRLLLGPLPKNGASEEAEEEENHEAPISGVVGDYKLAAEVYPNPFNPRATIRFRLHEAAPVKLQIFNISGQLVRTLVDSELAAGLHLRHWNASNHNGERVASGTYIYRLQVGNRLATGQMQLLK